MREIRHLSDQELQVAILTNRMRGDDYSADTLQEVLDARRRRDKAREHAKLQSGSRTSAMADDRRP